MDGPGPFGGGFVDAHWDRVAIMPWNRGVVYFPWLWGWPCSVGVEDGVFRAQDGQVDGFVGGVGDMGVVQVDEDGVEMGQDGRVDWIEGFVVRHFL